MKTFRRFAVLFLLCLCVFNYSKASTKLNFYNNIYEITPPPFTVPTSITGFSAYQDFQGKRYFKSTSTTTWKTAARIADSLGGHLAIPKNSAENTFLINFITADSWIGITDEAVEGTWLDIHGNTLTYTNWNAGEPNNTNGVEHFGHLIKTLGNWNDAPNTSLYNFVVVFDGVDTRSWTQVSTTTKSFNSVWNFTLPATDPNKEYKLIVSGTWGIANGIQHRDAAFECYSNININTYYSNGNTPWANRACADGNNWQFNGSCPPLIPTYPSGYATDHVYEYLIGKGIAGGYPIAFWDGATGDNSGSLTFTLYESTTTVTNLVTNTPFDLTVNTLNGGARNVLNWSSNNTDKLKYFNIYRSENNGINYQIIGKTNQNSFIDSTTIGTKSYKYKITEVDKFATNNILTAGLVNDFSFENSPNDTYYSLTTGTVNGATLTNDRFGIEKSAYAFNGSSYIEYPNTIANLTSGNVFTISVWEYKTPSSQGTNLIAKYWNLDATLSQLSINTNSVIGNGMNSISFAEPPSGWNQYTIVFKAGTNNTKVYRNGNLLVSGTLTYNASTTATKFYVGRITAGGSYSEFNGKIDDIKVFNRELTSSEITALYNNESITNTNSESGFSNSIATVASNKSIYVNKITGNNNNTGTLTSPFSTIQYAINNAISGDTIIISDHIYSESLSITNSFDKIIIASKYIFDFDSTHIKSAIIDATNTSWTNIHINSNANLIFKGITFKNAKGRLLSASGKNISFLSCQISNLGYNSSNITANSIIASNVYIDSTSVFNNNYISGIVTADSVSFTNSKFYNNSGALVSNSGGGMGGSPASAYIFNSLILNNSRVVGAQNTQGDYFIHNVVRQHVIRNKFSTNNYMNILGGSNVSYQKVINNLFYKTSGTAIARTVNVGSSDSLILIHNTFIANTADFTAHPNGFWKGLIYNNIFSSSITFDGPSPSGFNLITFKMLGNLFRTYPTFNQIDTSGSFQNNLYTSIKYKDSINLDFTYDDSEPKLGNGYLITYPILDDINGTPRPNPLGSKPEVGAFESKKSASIPNSPSLSAPESNDKKVILRWTDSNTGGIVKYRIYKDSVSISGATASNINNGLIAYFPFTGNILDSSGRGNSLLQSNITATSDRFSINNRAYNLNGSSAYLQSTTLSEEITNKSFSAWVKLSNNSQSGGGLVGIQSQDGSVFDAVVYNETNQGWGFGSDYLGRSKWSGVKEASTSNWVHVVATYEANLYKLYRNGILIDSTKNYNIVRFPTTSKINIGKRHDGGSNPFLAGDVDDVRVYNRSISSSEVLNLFNYESKNYAERSNSGTTVSFYKEINSPTLTYTDTVFGYKKYYYRITAINTNGVESDLSNEVSITTQSVADIKQVCVGATLTLASNSTTTWTQVGVPLTKLMTTGWTATLAGTDPNKKYKLVVSGTWGIANGVRHRDAAYTSSSSSVAITASGSNPVPNRGCDANWLFEGSCPPPVPNSPSGYASDNTYEYLIGNGKSGGFGIAFSDGNYGDNTGSLTYTLYESAASSTTSLLSTTTKAMTSAWSTNLAATDPNKKYKLVVSGTWGIANGVQHRDAAYTSSSSSVAITASGSNPVPNRGCDANWLFEGSCPPPVPNSPSGYASDNMYEYIIGNGKVGGYTIAFEDGNYGDNSGSLTFKLYEYTDGIWSSSDPSIATVNSTGVVTGIAPGIARILYTSTSGSGNTSDIQSVKVNDLPSKPVVTAGIWKLVSSVTKPMTSAFSQNFSSSSTKKYKLIVSGTWGIANGVRHRDPAYTSSSSSIAITAVGSNPLLNRGCDANWSLDGSCPPPTPTTPTSYSSSNKYEYYLGSGKSAGFTVAFSDGSYSDNSGSLTFDFYELVETPVNKLCVNSSADLVPNPLVGHSMRWYTSANGGTASYIQPNISTSSAVSNNFYATQVNEINSCESPRQLITTVVNANPIAPVVPISGVNLYQNSTPEPLKVDTLAGNSAFWYTSLNGTGSFLAPTPSTNVVGSTIYYVSQISNSTNCESPKATYTVIVNSLPTKPIVMVPANNQIKVETLPKFYWSKAQGVISYNFLLSKDSNFVNNIIDTIISDTQFVSNKSLSNNLNYYWMVKVKDASTYVKWSNINKFQTYILPPVYKSISAVGKVISYNWTQSDTTNVVGYKVYRDTIPFTPGSELDSVLLKGLVAHYGFNGNANDSSLYKNNATVTGATLVSDRFGIPNSAYEFNGTSNYITVPGKTTNDLTSNYTISLWLYAPTGLKGGQVLGKWGIGGVKNAAYILTVSSTGILNVTNNDGISNYGLSASRAISLDKWHHIVVRYSGDTLSLFSDNTLLDFKKGIMKAQSSKYNLDIGWESFGRYQYFKGKLDDIRLYERALSESEISTLYNYESVIPSNRTSNNNDSSKLLVTVSNNIFSIIDIAKENKTFYYRTSAVNSDKVESSLSNEANIFTLGRPTLISPLNNSFNVSQTPKFIWSNINNGFKNQLQISIDSNFTKNIIDSNSLDSSFTLNNKLQNNTSYYWRVRSIGKNNTSDWTNSYKFTTNLPVPNFLSLNGGNKIDTLSWSYSDTTVIKYYRIYRDTLDAPTKLIDSVSSDKLNYIDSKSLLLNTKYYYRISAVDNNGIESEFSSTRNIILTNKKPIVAVLNDKIIKDAGENNFVKQTLDGSSSSDVDGTIVSYNWYVNDSLVNNKDAILTYTFKQGTNEVKLVVADNDGDKDSTYSDISITSFVKQFEGGFLAGISAVSPNLIYTADSTFDPAKGASVYLLNRSGNIVYPLVVSSKVYTTPSVASDSSVFITSGSNLYGFSKTGAPLWSIIPLGGNSFVTPTIDSVLQRLYVGVSNKNFFAVDYKTGKVVWNLMSDAPINTSAVVTGDRKLVFTSEAGTLYGFDIFTNQAQTTPKWKISFGDIITKSPAVDDTNNIYIGTNTGRLIKLKLNDNGSVTVKWNVTLQSPIQSSPVIDADGNVYVGLNNGDFTKVNPSTGQVVWTFNTNSTINSAPFINEYGTIYIANELGYLYAIDANKRLKWMYKDVDGIVANILYTKGMLYFGSLSGTFTAIYDDPNSVSINTSISSNSIPNYVSQSITPTGSSSPITSREPIWGTFQGNYRRSGSKTLDCPIKPILITPNGTKSFCDYDSMKITYTDTVKNFVWKYESTILSSSNKTLVTNKSGNYTLAATNIYGCTVVSDSLKISSIPRPIAPVIARQSDGTLSSNYSYGNIWYKDGFTLSDTSQTIKPSSIGNYSLKVQQNSCFSNLSTPYYYVVTDVINLENGQYIKLNPNPFISQLVLSFSIQGHSTLNVDVFEFATSSKVAIKQNITSNSDLGLSGLSSGTYVVRVYSNDLKVNSIFKIIKL